MSVLLDSAEFECACACRKGVGWEGDKRVKITTTTHITCDETILLNLYHVISYVKNVIYTRIYKKGLSRLNQKKLFIISLYLFVFATNNQSTCVRWWYIQWICVFGDSHRSAKCGPSNTYSRGTHWILSIIMALRCLVTIHSIQKTLHIWASQGVSGVLYIFPVPCPSGERKTHMRRTYATAYQVQTNIFRLFSVCCLPIANMCWVFF